MPYGDPLAYFGKMSKSNKKSYKKTKAVKGLC